MFSAGDTIIYENYGVCRITGTREMEIGHAVRSYYELKPIFENNLTFYLPIGQEKIEAKMHPTLSVEEIYALIQAMPDEDTIWIENETKRKEQYKQILAGNDRPALGKRFKTLYLRQKDLSQTGKKLYVSDERFLRDAEKVLYDEFAYVLDIKQEEVLPFIHGHIQTGIDNLKEEAAIE